MNTPDVRRSSQRVTRQTLAAQVYEYLKESIMLDEIHAGERLNEIEIAKRLGVSQTPVREAIMKLEAEGLVTTDHWQGSYVRRFELEDANHLLGIRFALERLGLEDAIPLLSDEDIERLETIQAEYEDAHRSEPIDRLRAAKANAAFHQFFAAVAGNRWLMDMMNNLDAYLHVIRAELTGRSTGSRSIPEHRAIIQAVKCRDIDAAVERLREHIDRVKADVMRFRLQDS